MAKTCKYYKMVRQVSYDSGQTWTNLDEYQKGDFYERDSADCQGSGSGSTLYRWVNLDPSIDYYCSGTTKFYKQQKQVSYDNGFVWQNVSPEEYQYGAIAQTKSDDCGYVPRTPPEGLFYKYWGYNDYNNETILTYDSVNDTTKQNYWYGGNRSDVYIGNAEDDLYGYVGYLVPSVTHEMIGSMSMATLKYRNLVIPNNVLHVSLRKLGEDYKSIQLPNNLLSLSITSSDNPYVSGFTFPDSLYSLGVEFNNCINYKTLVVPKNVGMLSKLEGTQFNTVVFKSLIPPNISYYFDNVSSYLQHIYVPDSAVNRYKTLFPKYANIIEGGVDTDDSFSDNYQFSVSYSGGGTQTFPLTSNYIGHYYQETGEGYAFTNPVSSITSMQIADTVKVVNFDSLFDDTPTESSYPENLFTIFMGSNVKKIIGGTVRFPNLQYFEFNEGLLSIEGSLFRDSSLTYIVLPNSLIEIGDNTFEEMKNLLGLTIPNNVMHIGKRAFCSCTKMQNLTNGNSVITIGSEAFSGCTSLSFLNLGSGLKLIDYSAFKRCTSLTSVTIPSSVEFIGGYAFSGCSSLQQIVFESSTPPLIDNNQYNDANQHITTPSATAFDGIPESCKICVPSGSVDTYKNDRWFSKYSSKIISC